MIILIVLILRIAVLPILLLILLIIVLIPCILIPITIPLPIPVILLLIVPARIAITNPVAKLQLVLRSLISHNNIVISIEPIRQNTISSFDLIQIAIESDIDPTIVDAKSILIAIDHNC